MINGKRYVQLVKAYFSFLVSEFGLNLPEAQVLGNVYYDVRYSDRDKIVSISYENIEDYLLVIIFLLENGKLPDYDDKSKTLHLAGLNVRIMEKVTQQQRVANSRYFSMFTPEDELERKLLKGAKDLRLCLRHLKELSGMRTNLTGE